jgi:hypothetical protein
MQILRSGRCVARARTAVRMFAAPVPARATRRSSGVRSTAAVLSAFTACLAVSGCGDDHGAAAHAAPALPRPVTAQEAELLDGAEQSLVGRCMSGHGFKFWIPPHRPRAGSAVRVRRRRRRMGSQARLRL